LKQQARAFSQTIFPLSPLSVGNFATAQAPTGYRLDRGYWMQVIDFRSTIASKKIKMHDFSCQNYFIQKKSFIIVPF
jgi:hypothetical protein